MLTIYDQDGDGNSSEGLKQGLALTILNDNSLIIDSLTI